MKIKKIEWRNIGSFGNKLQSIDFSDKGELWQLYGRVGYGKSTILSLPTLVLYGKLQNVKIGDIANRINKNGWIRCECQVSSDEYVIERTFSPNSLKIYKNNELIDKARDLQGIIDNEIIGLPYYIFTNIISLSLNNFKSFTNMTPNDKRQIIDKLFSLEIINKIYDFIKKDSKDLGQRINELNNQIHLFEQTIKQSKLELEKLEKDNSANDEEQLKYFTDILVKTEAQINSNNDINTQLQAKYQEATNNFNIINGEISALKNDINNLIRQQNLYNQSTCPTCGTRFEGAGFDAIKDAINTQLKEKNDSLEVYTKSYNEFIEYINSIKSNIDLVVKNNMSLQLNRNTAINNINQINAKKNNNAEFSSIKNIISNASERKYSVENEIGTSSEKMNYLGILNSIYNNDGVKKELMNNYIPVLNEEIKETLIQLSFPYSLEFDNLFDPHLLYLGEEISLSTLSTGEGKKIDIAVLLSIIKMMKRKYPQLNMICLDETVSSLDYQSCEDVIKELRDIADLLDLNIFLVSHVQLPVEYFDKRILVTKNTGFSDVIYE